MATKTSGVPEAALYYFDTIVLSNFALSGRFDLLIDRYGPRAQITPEYLQGAQVHPCYTFSEALTNLATLLQKPRSGPAYFLFYFDQIDPTAP